MENNGENILKKIHSKFSRRIKGLFNNYIIILLNDLIKKKLKKIKFVLNLFKGKKTIKI